MQSYNFQEILKTKATRRVCLHSIASNQDPVAMRKEIEKGNRKFADAKKAGRTFARAWWSAEQEEIDEFGHTETQVFLLAEEHETPRQAEMRIHAAKHQRAMQYIQDLGRAAFWFSPKGRAELELVGKDILEKFPAISEAMDRNKVHRLDVELGEKVLFDDPHGHLGKRHAYICNVDPDYFGGYACRWSKPKDGKTWKATVVLNYYSLKKIPSKGKKQ